MELKDVLGEIESDGANLVHGRLLEWALTPPLWHADAAGGRPHHQALQARSPELDLIHGLVWGFFCQPLLLRFLDFIWFGLIATAGRTCWGQLRRSEGSPPTGAASRHELVCGRSKRTRTMMQSCASAAKLQSGGPSLPCGIEAMFVVGWPPPQSVVGRLPQQPWSGPKRSAPVCLRRPDGARRPPAARRSSPSARARSRGGQCCK